jgi:hypothetical protein
MGQTNDTLLRKVNEGLASPSICSLIRSAALVWRLCYGPVLLLFRGKLLAAELHFTVDCFYDGRQLKYEILI